MKRFDERKVPVFLLWATVLAIGVAVVVKSYIDLKKETRDVERLFEAHVASVVLLITEGAREATASTSLIYEIAENHLVTIGELLSDRGALKSDIWDHLTTHRIVVWISSDDAGLFHGEWGPVPQPSRTEFLAWMKETPTMFLADDGPLSRFALSCVRLESKETATIVCNDANELRRHRREIGIGPLLKGVTKKDIRYVALQDEEGILAVAPSSKLVSRLADDPFLAEVLAPGADGESRFRIRNIDSTSIFEGVVLFEMADESVVLLRVGIDGTVLQEVKRNALSRFIITLIWTTAGMILASLLFVFLKRWQRKQSELNARIEKEAAARKHWEDIGRMAATVAHEVRNPLNTMGMVSQRLKGEFTIPREEQASFEEMIGILISEGRRVEKVVTDFLALGKPMTLDRASHDLHTLLTECQVSLVMRAGKEGKHLDLDCPDGVSVFVDAKRFRQMMNNLVDNALDAVASDGGVHIDVSVSDPMAEIRITDNGKGLSDDQLAMVFTPFVSYKSNGNGLGLALVKRMAEAHGGTVTLSKNTGPGLTATLTLPRYDRTQP